MASYFEMYRESNRFIAAHRDESRCPLCQEPASESDHVFGRGSVLDTTKEHWALRMSLCRDCHHQKHHGSGFDRAHQAKVLEKANVLFLRGGEYSKILSAVVDPFREEIRSDGPDAFIFLSDWLVKNG